MGGKSEESVAIFNIKGRKKKQGEGVLLHSAATTLQGEKIGAQFSNEQVRVVFIFWSCEDKMG